MSFVYNHFNKYIFASSYYGTSYITSSSTSKSNLKNNTIYDIDADHAVVYLVKKNYLDYYAGTNPTGHYISGSAYYDAGSYADDEIRLMDCHWISSYAGTHIEPFNNVHEALHEYGSTNFIW